MMGVNNFNSKETKCYLYFDNKDTDTVNTVLGNSITPDFSNAITADEIVMAGGKYGTGNSNYYLYTSQRYWTMSPNR